jgi:excisionase family DNA binding protein
MNYISIPEAATMLGQSRQYIWMLVKAEKLKSQKIGNYLLVSKAAVEQRIRRQMKSVRTND